MKNKKKAEKNKYQKPLIRKTLFKPLVWSGSGSCCY